MGAEGEQRETVAVKTYVTADQKAVWQRHADELDMSLSEFVRSMVQAGRRGFDLDPGNGGSEDATPGGGDLEEEVLGVLSTEGPLEWDELVGELTGDFEDDLEATLRELQSANRVQYSGRRGGYTLGDEQ